jgi:transposase
VGATTRGPGTTRMAVAARPGLPLAGHTAAATPPDLPLGPAPLVHILTPEPPARRRGDKAYDREPREAPWAAVGIALSAPHRANRQPPAMQDGRPWRRYRRRWTMARLLAWHHHGRRLVVRHASHGENFLGGVHLGCLVILLRCYV